MKNELPLTSSEAPLLQEKVGVFSGQQNKTNVKKIVMFVRYLMFVMYSVIYFLAVRSFIYQPLWSSEFSGTRMIPVSFLMYALLITSILYFKYHPPINNITMRSRKYLYAGFILGSFSYLAIVNPCDQCFFLFIPILFSYILILIGIGFLIYNYIRNRKIGPQNKEANSFKLRKLIIAVPLAIYLPLLIYLLVYGGWGNVTKRLDEAYLDREYQQIDNQYVSYEVNYTRYDDGTVSFVLPSQYKNMKTLRIPEGCDKKLRFGDRIIEVAMLFCKLKDYKARYSIPKNDFKELVSGENTQLYYSSNGYPYLKNTYFRIDYYWYTFTYLFISPHNPPENDYIKIEIQPIRELGYKLEPGYYQAEIEKIANVILTSFYIKQN